MKNIFKNTYFGKLYRTRNGKKAVVDGFINGCPTFSVEGYNSHGIIYLSVGKDWDYLTPWLEPKGDLDIVSEWQESTNENELENLAEDYADNCLPQGEDSFGDESWCYLDVKEAYKAGYRKANQNKHIAIIAAIEHLVDNDLIK